MKTPSGMLARTSRLEVLARIDLHRTVTPAGTAPDEKQNCRGRQTARDPENQSFPS